jgi:alginate O-acetyltransferase complex protein AlgI
MVFSSAIFVFYFLPLFFLAYYLTPVKFKNAVILAGSIFFYAWGAPRFIFVILGTTAVDFYLVRWMDAMTVTWKRKALLVASVSINLGLLVYFKYSNFFVENINTALTALHLGPIPWLNLVLPIGISFYTFESLTYVVDVYRRVHAPLKHFWDYQLYIIFFPKLIAGPIVRYHDIADQIYDRSANSGVDARLRGLYRFFIGLGKKVLIANVMGEYADKIFGLPATELGTANAWLGALSYTFQIYFDFSGYSDMAIGLALMMGFKLPENFNNPYTALSITDFWRKWHITLGSWMRSYLYIPLGGNRVNAPWKLYFNLWIVFLASGLWHGAAWGFIIWGAYHGLFLVLERLFLGSFLKRMGKLAALYTFFVVLVGWVFFRLEHWAPSLLYLKRMFMFQPGKVDYDIRYVIITTVAALFSFFTLLPGGQNMQDHIYGSRYTVRRHYAMTFITIALLVLSMGSILTTNFNPFIYFRF